VSHPAVIPTELPPARSETAPYLCGVGDRALAPYWAAAVPPAGAGTRRAMRSGWLNAM
jgi:hypothetical protein